MTVCLVTGGAGFIGSHIVDALVARGFLVRVLERLGIANEVKAKLASPRPGEVVGPVVARGDAEIGIQQLSELLPVAGIDIIGPLLNALKR